MKDMTLPLLGTLIVGTLVGITAASCDNVREDTTAPAPVVVVDVDRGDLRGKLPSTRPTVRPSVIKPVPPAPRPTPSLKVPARTGGRR